VAGSPGFLRKAALLERDGIQVNVYPAAALAETALLRAGLGPGTASPVVLSGESLEECSRGRAPSSRGESFAAVGFDGSILWPARKYEAADLPPLAQALLPEGALFLFDAADGSGPGPRPGLLGRGVVVTRAAAQAEELTLPLLARGASPFLFPAIAVVRVGEEALAAALSALASFHGIVLTSANAVDRFLDALGGAGLDLRSLAGRRLYAVGSKTAAALAGRGLSPDAVPGDFRAEGLLDLLRGEGVAGRRFLLPRAEEAREILVEGIRRLGGEVEVVPLYRTVAADTPPDGLLRCRRAGMLDAVTFTSGSTFRHFLGIMGETRAREVLSRTVVACIGPVVAGEVREAGIEVAVVPARATVRDLVRALEDHFTAAGRSPARQQDT
jgi:uroporphyrinogen III methyltransferase/synthase